MSIKEEIKEVGRLSHIVGVLLEEGLETIVYELEIHSVVPIFSRLMHRFRGKEKLRRGYEERIVKALEKLGGMFVKAGEFLSTRPDLVTKEFAKILEQLEDKEISFKFSPEMVDLKQFSEFNETPVSAASFGQVHKAKLKDGTPVAVKIQRPDLENKVKTDLILIKWLLRQLKSKKPELKRFNFDEICQEIETYTFKELDYRNEAGNIAKFGKLFRENKDIVIPKVYRNLCRKNVLVMSWEEGDKIEQDEHKNKRIHKKINRKIQDILITSMTKQYFEYGVFQGDPSPGNFLVNKEKLVYLDLGIVGEFTAKQRKEMLQLILAISGKDIGAITTYLIQLNIGKKINYTAFYKANQRVIEDSSEEELFQNIFLNAITFKVEIPPNFILFAKSILTLAALVKELNPKTELGKEMEPTIVECMKKSLGYKPLIKFKLKNVHAELFSDAGKALDKIIEKI